MVSLRKHHRCVLALCVEMKDCRQAVQGLTFVGTENWFSSEHKRQ